MFLVLKLQHWKKKEYLFSLRGKKNIIKSVKNIELRLPKKNAPKIYDSNDFIFMPVAHTLHRKVCLVRRMWVFLFFFSVRRVSFGMCVCILSNANDKIYYLFNSIRWSIRFIFFLFFFCFLYSLTHHLFLSAFKMCVRIAHVLELECNKAC